MNARGVVDIKSRLTIFHGRPDLTPLIDVLFLLLIFVMLGSSFVKVSGVNVELPEVDSERSQSIEKFVVSVDRHSNIYFKDAPMSWESLKERLVDVSSASENATIILRSDSNTPFGVVARVMALAEEAGLNVFVATVPHGRDKGKKSTYVDER